MGRASRAVVRATADVHDAGDVDMGPMAAVGRICEVQDRRVSLRISESGYIAACFLSQEQAKIVGKGNRPTVKRLKILAHLDYDSRCITLM